LFSQPKFLSKEERAKIAISARAAEIRAEKEKAEASRKDRETLERDAEDVRRSQQEARYGGGGGGGSRLRCEYGLYLQYSYCGMALMRRQTMTGETTGTTGMGTGMEEEVEAEEVEVVGTTGGTTDEALHLLSNISNSTKVTSKWETFLLAQRPTGVWQPLLHLLHQEQHRRHQVLLEETKLHERVHHMPLPCPPASWTPSGHGTSVLTRRSVRFER
jgi:hypothetical protein